MLQQPRVLVIASFFDRQQGLFWSYDADTGYEGTRVRLRMALQGGNSAIPQVRSGGCFLLVPVEGCECWKYHVLDI